jgi:hypothetical protein
LDATVFGLNPASEFPNMDVLGRSGNYCSNFKIGTEFLAFASMADP